jgi:TatD DNase family protein
MRFIDTHCHLCDEKLPDTELVVNNYLEAGVEKVINMACCIETALSAREMSEKYPSVYFASGIHPMDLKDAKDGDLERIEKIANHPKCVAIGEIGLDYYWDKSYKEKQKQGLLFQLELCEKLKLPFSFHSREATLDTLTILKENKAKLVNGGVLHCFSGSVETAKEILKLGLKIGFGGTSTFKNARSVLEVASIVPDEAILVETDCPFLAPEPFRGTTNEPKNIPVIVKKLAEIRKTDFEELSNIIYNIRRW